MAHPDKKIRDICAALGGSTRWRNEEKLARYRRALAAEMARYTREKALAMYLRAEEYRRQAEDEHVDDVA